MAGSVGRPPTRLGMSDGDESAGYMSQHNKASYSTSAETVAHGQKGKLPAFDSSLTGLCAAVRRPKQAE